MANDTAPQMRMEVVEITPEQAEHYLQTAQGLSQRPLMQRRVAAFASAIARGQWMVTHQPVGIDPAGVLIDGQHRMAAIAMAGIPVRMLIAYDVPRDTFPVIDAGSARSTAVAVHMAGYTDANVTAASVRAVLVYGLIAGSTRMPSGEMRSGITTTDTLDFLASARGDTLRAQIAPARGIAQQLSRNGLRTPITAALTLIAEASPDDDLAAGLRSDFVDKLYSGAMLPDRSPIMRLRRWFLSDTGFDAVERNYRSIVATAAIVQSWNLWVAGSEPAGAIRFRPGREAWPVVADRGMILTAMEAAALEAEQRVSA